MSLRLVQFPLGCKVMGLNFDKFSQLLEAKIHEFDKNRMEREIIK